MEALFHRKSPAAGYNRQPIGLEGQPHPAALDRTLPVTGLDPRVQR